MKKKNEYFPESRPHPGEILAEKLQEMGMGPKEFAVRSRKPEQTINAILKGRSAITPDMAVQFEAVTGIPVHFWMNSQQAYDELIARRKYEATIEAATEWARNFPTLQMGKMGWIESSRNIKLKAKELLNFFGFSDHHAWEAYFLKGELKVAFRISLSGTHNPHAISAWLRKGELQAKQLFAKPYSEKTFREILPSIKAIMAEHPCDFFPRLQNLCLSAGVKVIHTPNLPKAPINGATRWINDHPLIQLTGRYKGNDIFWFTFFHEVGHILLHGKKDIFLEDIDYPEKNQNKEKEADAFAVQWTLNKNQEAEVLSNIELTEQQLYDYAQKFGTHPAIIIGRLQHIGKLKHNQAVDIFQKVDLDNKEPTEK